MQSPLSRYIMLAKRWGWLIVLGVVICGGGTYIVSKLIHPVYQASAFIVLNLGSSNTSAYDNTTASLEALPTYAQLLTNPAVLNPVVAQHKGLTYDQLNGMMTVKPQANTQIIELDVQNTDPQLAMQLANEISRSFAQYANTQLPASVQILPAVQPTSPVYPKPSLDAAIGGLVGLGLALALIVIFEWFDDRLTGPEEAPELLDMETLAVIPRLSGSQRKKQAENAPGLAEGCRMLCASLIAAQATKPLKLVMVTSALAGEGKSTIAANLAYFLAIAGKQVLLVDADLRRPALHHHYHLDNSEGLSSVLQDKWVPLAVEAIGQETAIPTLRVLTAGAPSSNFAELLQSPLANQLFDFFNKTPFDYIIFDTPPLLPVADAQILALRTQAAVLVVDASKTPRKVLLRAKSVLKRAHIITLGVVLNKSRWSEQDDILQYQSELRQPPRMNGRIPMTPSIPREEDAVPPSIPAALPAGSLTDITVPATPPIEEPPVPDNGTLHSLDDAAEADITITLPRRPNGKDEHQGKA